jgi:molybdate transport repressor ModE-like protein
MNVKTKVWVEDKDANLLLGDSKAVILKYINELGSISKAAKKANINYKKAWTHLNSIENILSDEVVIRKKGGANGGGTTLTSKGLELINKFNIFEEEIKKFADKKFKELFLDDKLITIESKHIEESLKQKEA